IDPQTTPQTNPQTTPRTQAAAVPTSGNQSQNLSQTKGRPKFGFGSNGDGKGKGRKSPVASPTSVNRPSNGLNGNKKGGLSGSRFGQALASNRIGKGKNQARPTPTAKPRPKIRPSTLFPESKKKPLSGFKSFGKTRPFGKRQALNQTLGGLSLNADEDNDGDDAGEDDDGDDEEDDDYSYFNTTFVVPFNGKNIVLEPQYDQTQNNRSSTRRPRFIGMTLTGLHSAPFGTADVTFIAVPCIRGLIWTEQTLGHILKESAVAMGLWAWIGVIGLLAVSLLAQVFLRGAHL
ncbi:hypothetical protein FRC00_013790, partial [Tulasnella sp. 408]